MAYWRKLKRFGYARWFPRPKTERHWDTLYKGHKTIVPNIQQLTLEWSQKGAGQTGVRHFKYYSITPLQYWNKSLKVNLNKNQEKKTPEGHLTIEERQCDGIKCFKYD